MDSILVQFASDDHSIGSKLIEWFDHGQFSHVDSVLPDGTLLGARDDVINGIASGVQIRPADYVRADRIQRVAITVSPEIANAYYTFVRSQIGKPYDETAIAAFAVGRNWREPDSWFCSELCAAAFENSGLFYPLAAACSKIAPDDLLLVISGMVDLTCVI
jgi:hypothetical protein